MEKNSILVYLPETGILLTVASGQKITTLKTTTTPIQIDVYAWNHSWLCISRFFIMLCILILTSHRVRQNKFVVNMYRISMKFSENNLLSREVLVFRTSFQRMMDASIIYAVIFRETNFLVLFKFL